MIDLTIGTLKKKYDYWLIVWINKDGEEVHQPVNFQCGVHPKEWCDLTMDKEVKGGKGEIIKQPYQSYKLLRLFPSEYSEVEVKK